MVLEKTLESPLDCKEIQPVHSEGDQSWVYIGRTDAKAELQGRQGSRDEEVSLPSVEVDTQAPGAKLEGDLSLGDKEVAARGRTLRTEDDVIIHVMKPHFKFPRLFSSPGKSLRSSTLVEGDPHLSLPPIVSDVDPSLPDISSHKLSLPCPRVGWTGASSGSLDVSSSHAESSSVSPEAVTLIKYQMTVSDAPHFPPEIPSLQPGKSHEWRSLVGCSPWGC